MISDPDDLIPLHNDDAPQRPQPFWHVLVVDDDPEVHSATRFVLRGQQLLGRQVSLHSAYSAAQARDMLSQADTDFAVVLLDVVMEQSDAGLNLIHTIRRELGLQGVRIILRTGQPGYAPELEVISRYDINDYRTKSELTQTRLVTSLISALRSFEQIRRIEASQRGLSQIIQATRDLLSSDGLQRFAGGVLTQLGAFLSLGEQRGLVVISPTALGRPTSHPATDLQVVAASGHYQGLLNGSIDAIEPAQVRDQLVQALREGRNIYGPLGCALHCRSQRHQLAVFMDTADEVDASLRELLEIFTENVALCSDNLSMLEQLQRTAFVDALTGLPSRLRLLQRMGEAPFPDDDSALLLIDIDDFNTHVETLGPTGSDLLLRSVAQRLLSLPDVQPMTVVRFGGDVFALHGPAEQLGQGLLQTLCDAEFDVDGLPIRLSMCGGLARRADLSGAAPATLLAAAFTALKSAKRERRPGYVRYHPEMGRAALRRASLSRALHAGLQQQAFRLVLQPQIRLSDGEVLGVEALLRWGDESGVSPAEFIPVAESTGLILPLGTWVIDEACAQLAQLQRRTGLPLRMAINVSLAQWRDNALLGHLDAAARRHGLQPQQVEIELTESLAMQEVDQLLPRLHALRERGMRVALDDFGTGFSSLAYLQHMPVDLLKIDRSFVHEIGCSRRGEDIVRTIVSLGRLIGLEVLAEGVETLQQEDFLRGLGCDATQGYLRARPMGLDALCDWLARRRVDGVADA
ncbi:putative bifunctional diguanylate cyclase/phosphodiesterase [Sphaerotilus mobilis]|uniref:EAL domain-containing protein (Putative c-di-GMP-specific phosphodiesterase class I) n=1 Tax=Sphaerotilus mobilis TaxID=47994 RepID=A0A4Q7LRZ8_9BURK|nr:EAL domain-containing protein [Sphaerotilus mobilis]RZS56987.1 EAL domain-containing protein (putative c-di-GMP-specific phosphodiesterase class I) [Sphaerotilus mobilis]